MKVLFYGESPAIMTGLAQVSREICDALIEDGHEVEMIGVNHFLEDYDHDRYPFVIHPCPVDVKDGCKNLDTAKERILSGEYDIFFFGCDLGGSDQVFQWRREVKKDFVTVVYAPIDCDQVPADIFTYFDEAEFSITYTNHGKSVINRYCPHIPISVIYLACHPEKFYPLSQEEKSDARRKLFNITDDTTFIVTNVNRNQGRKDLYRTLAIFHEFHKLHPNSVLYMHCQQQDAGGYLPTIAKSIGMRLKADAEHPYAEIVFAPETYLAIWGFSDESMNLVYNASDCLVSTSTGEGWGLSTTDAMCAGTPVIVPGNTANLDLIGENEERGWLIKTGGDIDHQIVLYGMTCNPRDIVHADSMLVNMEIVHETRGTLRLEEKTQKAREWCLQYTPEKIKQQWKNLFSFIVETMLKEGATA